MSRTYVLLPGLSITLVSQVFSMSSYDGLHFVLQGFCWYTIPRAIAHMILKYTVQIWPLSGCLL